MTLPVQGRTVSTDPAVERLAELEEDNQRLRRLLDQRDAPGELRHRLRSTIGLLRAVLRKSANTPRDLPLYVAHLEDRLDAIARAQALADQHGEVSLRVLLTDELLQYGASEGEKLLLSGPDVRLTAKVGQVMALALHELAVNAVEHGVLGRDGGRVEVSWDVLAVTGETGSGDLLIFTWRERGSKRGAGPVHSGFGTEVLTRMLPYDLGAETEIVTGVEGLRCTVRFRMPAAVGRIAEAPRG